MKIKSTYFFLILSLANIAFGASVVPTYDYRPGYNLGAGMKVVPDSKGSSPFSSRSEDPSHLYYENFEVEVRIVNPEKLKLKSLNLFSRSCGGEGYWGSSFWYCTRQGFMPFEFSVGQNKASGKITIYTTKEQSFAYLRFSVPGSMQIDRYYVVKPEVFDTNPIWSIYDGEMTISFKKIIYPK